MAEDYVLVRPDEADIPGIYKLTYWLKTPYNTNLVKVLDKAVKAQAFLTQKGKVVTTVAIPPDKNVRLGRSTPWQFIVVLDKTHYNPEDKVVTAGYEKGIIALIGLAVAMACSFAVIEKTIERAKDKGVLPDVEKVVSETGKSVSGMVVFAGLVLLTISVMKFKGG